MTKKEIVQYLKQNMPTFTGNKIEKEKKMAMYIYLELGKMKAFDEKYFFGNSKTKDKVKSKKISGFSLAIRFSFCMFD